MTKVYKIKYSVNLIPIIGPYIIPENKETGQEKEFINDDVELMNTITASEELDIFETESIQQLIEFKWQTYAMKHHVFGCVMHFFYLTMLVIYTHVIYINNSGDESSRKLYTILLAIGILYPAGYDISQMLRVGLSDYLADVWNYSDLLYIWSSVANVILQNVLDPFSIACKIVMIIIFLLCLVKTFFFLRIFK